MDLKQISYFMWVYEEGSFSRAAAKANVVQSALSMQIRRIEDEFGVLLFNRLSRGVEPTDAGRKFYERCIPIARNFALAQEELTGASETSVVSGIVRVGLPGSFNRGILSSVLLPFMERYGLDFYNILIISFIMGAIQKSLNLSLTEAGVITTVTLAGSVIGGVLFGWLGDRVGRKNSLLWTLGLFSVGAILSAFAWDFNSLLVTRAITGIGLGGEWGAGIVLFNEVWDKKRRGFGSSVIQAASTGGIAAASIVSVWALSSFSPDWGWRVALLTGGAPIVLMIYVRFWMPESKLWLEYERMRAAGELPPEKAQAASPLIEIFKGASLRYTLLGILVVSGYMFAFYSVTVFMPAFMRSLGAESEAIRTVTIVFSCGLAAAFLIFGWFTDSLGRKVGVVFPTLISIVGFIGIYYSAGTAFPGSLIAWPLFAWYVLWGVGQTAAGMFGCWFSELYPVELRSSAVSTIYMVGRGIGSIAPFVVPMVATHTTSGIAGGMLAGLGAAVICAIAALLLPETAGRSFSVIETKARSAT